MPISGMGTSGIVAIPIPAGGAAGEVLTKVTADDYDFDWAAGGGGGGSLQDAYDFATAAPQIVVNATPDPVTIESSVSGIVFEVRTSTPEVLLRMTDTGSSIFGGVNAGNLLNLQGSQAANRGRNVLRGGVDIDWDFTSDAITTGGIRFANVIPSSGGLVSANIFLANDIVVDNGLFIMSALDDNTTLRWTVAPGFAVTTLFFARQVYRSTTLGIAPAQAFNYAAQCQYDIQGAGAVTVPTYRALSFAPIIRARNAGDDLRITATTGMTVQPLFNTNNATATADFGTIRGVHMFNATAILFGQSLGSEIADNWIGLDMEPLTGLVVSGVRAAVRSAIPASGTSNFVILNLSNAPSDFGAGGIHFDDNTPVQFGGTAFNAQDASVFWDGTSLDFFFAANSDTLAFSNAVNAQILIDGGANELTFNTTQGFSLGAQTGTNGNQFGNFVAGARTTLIGGEWSDFLLTQAANITVDDAMSLVVGWTINAPSITIGTGTVTDAGALNVGGNVNQGSVNRFGVRIISNPSGGSGVNAGLWVTAGRSRFDGIVDINNGDALGGGAAATLGTIGGTGPTAAAQAQWLQVEINGVNHWIPVWT